MLLPLFSLESTSRSFFSSSFFSALSISFHILCSLAAQRRSNVIFGRGGNNEANRGGKPAISRDNNMRESIHYMYIVPTYERKRNSYWVLFAHFPRIRFSSHRHVCFSLNRPWEKQTFLPRALK